VFSVRLCISFESDALYSQITDTTKGGKRKKCIYAWGRRVGWHMWVDWPDGNGEVHLVAALPIGSKNYPPVLTFIFLAQKKFNYCSDNQGN